MSADHKFFTKAEAGALFDSVITDGLVPANYAWLICEAAAEVGYQRALAEDKDLTVAYMVGYSKGKEDALAKQGEPVACVQDLDEVKRKHLVYEKGMDWKDPLYTTPQPAAQDKLQEAAQQAPAALLGFIQTWRDRQNGKEHAPK